MEASILQARTGNTLLLQFFNVEDFSANAPSRDSCTEVFNSEAATYHLYVFQILILIIMILMKYNCSDKDAHMGCVRITALNGTAEWTLTGGMTFIMNAGQNHSIQPPRAYAGIYIFLMFI